MEDKQTTMTIYLNDNSKEFKDYQNGKILLTEQDKKNYLKENLNFYYEALEAFNNNSLKCFNDYWGIYYWANNNKDLNEFMKQFENISFTNTIYMINNHIKNIESKNLTIQRMRKAITIESYWSGK